MKILLKLKLLVFQHTHLKPVWVLLEHQDFYLMQVQKTLRKLIVFLLLITYYTVKISHEGAVVC